MPEIAEPEEDEELGLPETESSVDDDVTLRSVRSIDPDYLTSLLEQMQEGGNAEDSFPEKRGHMGFQAMRGKRPVQGFHAMRGKRPMQGFHAVRGKRPLAGDFEDNVKRTFYAMRGKRPQLQGFHAVRGRRAAADESQNR